MNPRELSEWGVLPNRNSDIYTTFTAAMIKLIPKRQREFLAVIGIADESTIEMKNLSQDASVKKILSMLTEQNEFVKSLPDTVTYRFRHRCSLEAYKKII